MGSKAACVRHSSTTPAFFETVLRTSLMGVVTWSDAVGHGLGAAVPEHGEHRLGHALLRGEKVERVLPEGLGVRFEG